MAGGDFIFGSVQLQPVGSRLRATRELFCRQGCCFTGAGRLACQAVLDDSKCASVALPGDIVRLAGSVGLDGDLSTRTDNIAFEIGDGGPGKGVLSDGADLKLPNDVTLVIEAGAILKLAGEKILVGSEDASNDRSGSAIQVLGTPRQSVFFTSHFDQSLGIDTNLLDTVPSPGQWGGIEIRNDVDAEQGRRNPELDGIFLNYVSNADIRTAAERSGSALKLEQSIRFISTRLDRLC